MTLRDDSIHTQILREGDRAVAIRRAYLRVTVKAGPDKGLRSQHAGERIVIGTHKACDVVLTDPTISRQHCEITLARRGYLVRDLDSTNGCFLDKVRVDTIVVEDEVTLRLGSTRLTLTPLRETVDLPVAADASFGPLLGRSVAMRRVFDLLGRLAPSEITVLITGESGTGKELAAQAIHEASPRRRGPFRIVDCGAIPVGLIESEFFGHVRGAFTGADRAHTGAFVAANGGTLFLDEIGELPLELQPRLLGAIERRRVQPVGGTAAVDVDVRILAATNRDLRREINRGTFREDLFFRLAGAIVEMPPLRERPEDIPLYVEQLFDGRAQLDAHTLLTLGEQRWPGNVRELRNALERAVAGVNEITAQDAPHVVESFPAPIDPSIPYKVGKALLLEQFDRRYFQALLARHGDNITQAARAAQLDRVHFLRLLDRFGLRPSR